ncbi:dynein axonemal heavy chain 1 [Anopheles cruzii]|uniref:dynein axonemal heavy chain 1 n=1 Tax=Anopheles cruzii TaxID=68878 RepID=UPI0022EC9456|nr:dynein axonemal heavy chain 1 [Anopheles cruzii]
MALTINPTKFANRIAAAVDGRGKAENCIRFEFLCSHIATGDYFAPDTSLAQRLLKRTTVEIYGIFKQIYEDFHLRLAVGQYLNTERTLAIKQPLSYGGTKPYSRLIEENLGRSMSFDDLRDRFKRNTLLCHRNVFYGLRLVNFECDTVRKLMMFALDHDGLITLDEFEKQNQVQTSKAMKYLQNNWIERTTMHLHRMLSRIGPGSFDVAVAKWNIYSVSKVHRLVEQVKYRMQDTLRDLLFESTAAYIHHLVNDCRSILSLDESFSWDTNLIDSPFEPQRSPVFRLTMEMGPKCAFYSTDPDQFLLLLPDIMDVAIEGSHFVHTIEPSLMQSLIFVDNLYLSSVGLIDPVMVEQRNRLVSYYRKSAVPLQAYATRYNAYMDLFFTNVQEFTEQTKATDKTSSELKEDIEFQIRMRQNLERTVPLSITIGPFWVSVEPLREALIRKRHELADALLTLLAEKLRLKTADMIAQYVGIIERMCEKPVSIEHIHGIREFMEHVPELLSRMEDRMKGLLYEYEILDGFQFNLPDVDFQQKWNALGYPRSVLRQMSSVKDFHETEVEKFRKQQFADEAAFSASVENMNVHIAKFTTLYDVGKVSEMAVEVRRLWKALQELIEQGHVMNCRQELFELPPIGLHNLFELRDNFRAYRDLWTVAADYLKLEETWIGNPLASVELDSVRRGLQHAHDHLKVLLPLYRDQPQILAVVEHFIHTVEAFRPNLDVMELLKCSLLEPIHFSQLAKEADIKVKLSVDMGFDVFLEHDIRSHLKTIRAIVQRAEELKLQTEQQEAEEARVRQQQQAYKAARDERRQKRTEI